MPDPQSTQTFDRSCLHWHDVASPDHAELLRWYRALIALRRRLPSLRDGNYRAVAVAMEESQGRFYFRRSGVLVACNLGAASTTFHVTG